MDLQKGLVISDAQNDTEIVTLKAYKATIVRLSRHYDDLKNPSRLINEVKKLDLNDVDWVLLTGHSHDEMNKADLAIPYIHDLLVALDKAGAKYPKMIILGNENNELQLYWHNEAKRLHIRFPKITFIPQAPTSIGESGGYACMTHYLTNNEGKYFNNLAIHFYLRPTWKWDSWFDNLRRINRLLNILILSRGQYISNVHMMESHDADVEHDGGDLVISSYFGDRALSLLCSWCGLHSRYHYNVGGLNKALSTVLSPTKRDLLSGLVCVVSLVVLLPYTLYTLIRLISFKMKG